MATSRSFLTATHTALTPPARVTLYAVLGLALLFLYQQIFVFRSLIPPIGLIQLVPMVIALITFVAHWRWAPLLSAIFCVLLLVWAFPFVIADLSHPEPDLVDFVWTILALLCIIPGAIAGIVATVRHRS